MKVSSFFGSVVLTGTLLACAFLGMNQVAFAANTSASVVGTSSGLVTTYAPSQGGLSVTKVVIVDDRNLVVSFSPSLAEEPVNIGITEVSSKKSLGIAMVSVSGATRTEVAVQLTESMNPLEKYTVLVRAARGVDGSTVSQNILSGGYELASPNSIPVSTSTSTESTKPKTSLADSVKQDEAIAAQSAKTTSQTTNGASAKSSASLAAPMAFNSAPVQSSSAASSAQGMSGATAIAGSTLPKTGAETWLLVLLTCVIAGVITFRKRSA